LRFEGLRIGSPKRTKGIRDGWEGFFPYYAGFPEQFASDLLASAKLSAEAVVLDPWNGSGTTTYSAARLGLKAIGVDINPVMVVVARARLLPSSEADSLLAAVSNIKSEVIRPRKIDSSDPLLDWFGPQTANTIRFLEEGIRRTTVSYLTLTDHGVDLGRISGLAAALYVALFDACRQFTTKHRSSNPTWLRGPVVQANRIGIPASTIVERFVSNVRKMAAALGRALPSLLTAHPGWQIDVADSTTRAFPPSSIDCVLTSPPYCTRIDYTAATRVELAVLAPLMNGTRGELSRQMIGSVRVPQHAILPHDTWGATCLDFLNNVKNHKSKASATYYYRTHLDYFDKMARSMSVISSALKRNSIAIFVVQDSHYKEVHNDLPKIISEMALGYNLRLRRRVDFRSTRSMARINRHTRLYGREAAPTEAVLCFEKVT